ncbi:MAG: glycoside hydrolase family 36 protein [Candidatus Limivivens sp.]|nr:glycoside hydrolase family 36 protein [Candidatus Limivivens sp.]
MKKTEYQAGDMILRFCVQDNGQTGFSIVPEKKRELFADRQERQENCVQVRLAGEDYPNGFSNGHTYRNSQTACELQYRRQFSEKTEEGIRLHTEMETSKMRADFVVEYREKGGWLKVWTEVTSLSDEILELEMVSSFSMGGIFPSGRVEDIGRVRACRIRSKWSNEGRLEKTALEDLQLEPSWSGYGAASERFGQTGSLPVRKFFPIAGIEDEVRGVSWGARLAVPSSWQMEFYRRGEELCLSGGLPDLDFGHWKKRLLPREIFVTPEAYLTVCEGDFDRACRRLVQAETMSDRTGERPPVIFNEYCTTWGNPSEENIRKILSVIKDMGMDYFVIDAGWYADEIRGWEMNMGDWKVNPRLFPSGLGQCTEMIREAGLKPGIWFEIETVGRDAEAFQKTELLLKRNGQVITVGNRRFWDMRNPETVAYLTEHVIRFLKEYRFEYLKIDYNDSIGMGCDGAESPGEGLRQAVLASREFLKKIREELPGLVVENCSSGGHRLESSMMALSDFVSFSDAHEEKEIPVIAANLHRILQPSKSEIWAVLRTKDDRKRLCYSLCNTFLGVMCLSGDIYEMSPEGWNIVQEAIRFYREAGEVIQKGTSYLQQNSGKSYRHLTGWQSVLRVSEDGRKIMVISHNFRNACAKICWDLQEVYPTGDASGTKAVWRIADVFGEKADWKVENGKLSGTLTEEFSASALLLEL